MRIAIIGAGAIGGTIAVMLETAGHDVTITARGAHLDAIRSDGLALDSGWGERVAHPTAVESLAAPPAAAAAPDAPGFDAPGFDAPAFDLAFVCTKATDAPAAITLNRDALAGIPVVVVQNGLDGLTVARELLPDSTVVGALALYAASFLTPGRITVTATGPTFVGDEAEPSVTAKHVAHVLAQAMPTEAVANFSGCQWTKLVINQVNAAPAVTGLSVQACIAHAGLRRMLALGMQESVAVGLASGVRFGSLQGLSNPLLLAFAAAPPQLAEVLLLVMARRMGRVPNPGSTLQSIRRGQPTEVDHLNGAVVRAAEHAGVEARVNGEFVELVHEVERTGRFINPERVTRRVRAARVRMLRGATR